MADVSQKQFAELVTWTMCQMASGAGPGKCDPSYCVCGTEGEVVAKSLYDRGYVLVERNEGTRSDLTPTWRS